MSSTVPESRREARLRRKARREGYVLRKSRLRGPINVDDHGEYMIVDAALNCVVTGERFDLTLDDVERFLADD